MLLDIIIIIIQPLTLCISMMKEKMRSLILSDDNTYTCTTNTNTNTTNTNANTNTTNTNTTNTCNNTVIVMEE